MEGNGIRMGKTLGIDRETARRIKRMSCKELDGYLTRVTDQSYDNGYEEGLVDGIALSGQGLDVVLKGCVADNLLTQQLAKQITKAVGEYIAAEPERVKEGLREAAQGAAQSATGCKDLSYLERKN